MNTLGDLSLPCTPEQLFASVVRPALDLLPDAMTSPEAVVMLLAIAQQESGLRHRCQVVNGGGRGPARGLWQFERGGGTAGVIRHSASRYWAARLAEARGVDFTSAAIWRAFEYDDILAAGFARLLLFTDPKRLPRVNDADGGWALYLRTWRPGKPHPAKWAGYHAAARRATEEAFADA